MERKLAGLEPERLFYYFEELTRIPRGSGNEKGVADFICAFAEKNGLEYYRDALHNVLITKKASPGRENIAPVMLQGHIDMVCEKDPGVVHDFTRDPIELLIEDGWIKANGTTLGADNGVAVAMMLAILEDASAVHPTLECLFTSQEEVGLVGARAFDGTKIKSRRFINLDSGKPGRVSAGCAGAERDTLTFRYPQSGADGELLKMSVSGFAGGHSAGNMRSTRENAIRFTARILAFLYKSLPFRLVSLDGGNKMNAYPLGCDAVIVTPDAAKAEELARSLFCEYKRGLCEDDAGAKLEFSRHGKAAEAFTSDSTRRLLDLLTLLPNGVNSRLASDYDTLESSTSLGIVRTDGNCVTLTVMPRSSSETRLDELAERFDALARAFGGEILHSDRYPGWEYDPDSRLRALYKRVCKDLTGLDTEVVVAHGGLECGVIGSKLGKFDAMATCAHIKGAHSPNERVNIDTFATTYKIVREMLARME